MRIDKIGMEIETSVEIAEEIENTFSMHDYSYENDEIKELNTEPIKAADFKKFLAFFKKTTEIAGFDYVQGESDANAGSNHLHISFLGDIKENNNVARKMLKKLMRVYPLTFVFFSRKSYSYFFRDIAVAWTDYRNFCRAELRLNYDDLVGDYKSKAYWLTVNFRTVEFRINENPLPLFIYLLPIICENAKYTKELNKITKKMSPYADVACSNFGFTNYEVIKELTEEAVDAIIDSKDAVLAHWKPKMAEENFVEFCKVMDIFYSARFDNVKTFNKL